MCDRLTVPCHVAQALVPRGRRGSAPLLLAEGCRAAALHTQQLLQPNEDTVPDPAVLGLSRRRASAPTHHLLQGKHTDCSMINKNLLFLYLVSDLSLKIVLEINRNKHIFCKIVRYNEVQFVFHCFFSNNLFLLKPHYPYKNSV